MNRRKLFEVVDWHTSESGKKPSNFRYFHSEKTAMEYMVKNEKEKSAAKKAYPNYMYCELTEFEQVTYVIDPNRIKGK